MNMWQFMEEYADSFWRATIFSWEVFSVIMAWAITLELALAIMTFIWGIGEIIADAIKDRRKG